MQDQDTVLAALKTVLDPELNVNIVDLGLIYNVLLELFRYRNLEGPEIPTNIE